MSTPLDPAFSEQPHSEGEPSGSTTRDHARGGRLRGLQRRITTRAVIGAGYGDEGKGLVTDYLCANLAPEPTVVVRSNGGAQAGHTVVMPDGRRHVFSHVGSGALRGVPTYLSRHFVAHPLVFAGEVDALRALGVSPRVWIDPAAPVTTPYDVMLNQALESARGASRHGSCGLGFGETIQRDESPQWRLRMSDLGDELHLRDQLRAIRDYYLPARLRALGLPDLPAQWTSERLMQRFAGDAMAFAAFVDIAPIRECVRGRHVVFEGAQGLMLDMDYGDFPHVTRSHTGLRNVIGLAAESGREALDVTYVTRSYVTRHGRGPMAHELARPPNIRRADLTNVANPWQGSLRYGWLDVDVLTNAIAADLAVADELGVAANGAGTRTRLGRTTLCVTCLDQIDGHVPVYQAGGVMRHAPGDLPSHLARATRLDWGAGVWGTDAGAVGAPEPATPRSAA